MHFEIARFVEPLEDRTLLSSVLGAAGPTQGIVNPGAPSELTLTVPGNPDNDGSRILSFHVMRDNSVAGNNLNPSAITISRIEADNSRTSVTPLFSNGEMGSSESLMVANLRPGTYELTVRGDNGTHGAFLMNVYLPGDVNGDGRVTEQEYQQATAAMLQQMYGINQNSGNLFGLNGIDFSKDQYDIRLDANRDGTIDPFDLQVIDMNMSAPRIDLVNRPFVLVSDQQAPTILPRILNDTGPIDAAPFNNDGYTSELDIRVDIFDQSDIAAFSVRLHQLDGNGTVQIGSSVNLMQRFGAAAVNSNNNGNGFVFSQADLEQMFGLEEGGLSNTGEYELRFTARDVFDNVTVQPVTLRFQIDTIAPVLEAPPSDLDTQENVNATVDLVGVFSHANDPPVNSQQLFFRGRIGAVGVVLCCAAEKVGSSNRLRREIITVPVFMNRIFLLLFL
jgi:hypothetical protein